MKEDIKKPKPDGRANNGSVAKIKDGRPVNVYLDAASLARAAAIGSGNVSEGIRRALADNDK